MTDLDMVAVLPPLPIEPASGRTEVFLRVVAKVRSLPGDELRRSRLPSGWTVLELLKHLRYVEVRWIEWGFQGRSVEPWRDRRGDRWHVGSVETCDELITALLAQGANTRRVLESNELSAVGAPSPRWDGADPPSLERVLFHLLQEYARHLGHLDIVVELAGGPVGQ